MLSAPSAPWQAWPSPDPSFLRRQHGRVVKIRRLSPGILLLVFALVTVFLRNLPWGNALVLVLRSGQAHGARLDNDPDERRIPLRGGPITWYPTRFEPHDVESCPRAFRSLGNCLDGKPNAQRPRNPTI